MAAAARVPLIEGRMGLAMPLVGQGTWHMGEDPRRRDDEVAALRLGLDLGLSLIDTAEMYGDGGAEEVVAEALLGRRGEVFLVSKVLPQNASRAGTVEACERSLGRLRTDCIDLYLLHWAGRHPLGETYAAFEELLERGMIRHYGVSNFDARSMARSERLPGGARVAANQVLYNLERRNIEAAVLPWCRDHDVVVMAYSPLEQARMRPRGALESVARRHGITPYQAALAWTVRGSGVVTIPKATRPEHVRLNAAVARIELTREDLVELDAAFPRPASDPPLDVL